jgi:hypothetical protein
MVTDRLPFAAAAVEEAMTKRHTRRPRPQADAMPSIAYPDVRGRTLDRAPARRAPAPELAGRAGLTAGGRRDAR